MERLDPIQEAMNPPRSERTREPAAMIGIANRLYEPKKKKKKKEDEVYGPPTPEQFEEKQAAPRNKFAQEQQDEEIAGTEVARQEAELRRYEQSELAGPQQGQGNQALQHFPGDGLMNRGYEKQRKGTMLDVAAQADAADTEAGILQEGAEQQKELNADYLDKQKELESYKNEVVGKADVLLERMREKKIDPNRFWNNRTTGQKIMLAFGAFASGYSGKGGQFIKQVKSFMDRDLDLQKDAYNRLGNEAKNMISIASQIYEPGLEAAEAARSMGLEALKSTLQAKLATTKSQKLRASIPKMMGLIDVEQGKAMNTIAINRLKQAEKKKKSIKLGSEAARAIGQGVDALYSVQQMRDFVQKEGGGPVDRNFTNTFLGLGDNKFTDGLRQYTTFVGFLNSGANVPKDEKKSFNSTIVRLGDGADTVKFKLQKAQKLLKRRIDIYGQGAGYEPGEIFKNLQLQKDERVRDLD